MHNIYSDSFFIFIYFSPFSQTVSIDEIASVRRGRQSEGLTKHTDTTLEDLCFSIFFKDRKKNLDLMASSQEEANHWVTAIEKVISNMQNLSQQQKSEQYPSQQTQQRLKFFQTQRTSSLLIFTHK